MDLQQPNLRRRTKYPHLDGETLALLEADRRPPGRPRMGGSDHISHPPITQPQQKYQAEAERRPSGRPRKLNASDHVSHPPITQPQQKDQAEVERRPSGRPRKLPQHLNASDHVSHPLIPRPQRKRQRVQIEIPAPSQALVDVYNERQTASILFPPKISSGHIRAAMRRYDQVIDDACAEVESSCASCGEFKAKDDLSSIPDDDRRLHLSNFQLDNCSLQHSFYQFCQSCFHAFNNGKIPKFSAMNDVNVTMCQDYPPELEDLTLMEEYTIARSHPIGAILKLRPNGLQSTVAYNAIRGHIITIPQNPGPLLDILPSPDLQFYDHIRIVWLGKSDPTSNDLKPFVQVRKEKVLRALLWLCGNNPLYNSVTINWNLIDQWESSFIPSVLQNGVVNIPEEEDSAERGTYAGDMDGFAENDLHHTLDDMADGMIASGSVHSDVEGQRLNPELKMVLALMNFVNKADQSSTNTATSDATNAAIPEETPVITWKSNNTLVLMNDYEDATFFTSAFPSLFPYGKGGHISSDERSIPVSLEAWAKWSLNHHSRRFARHPTFMYLLYDVIQRRKAALGNSLLVKRRDYEAVQQIISSLTYDRLIEAAQSLRTSQRTSDPAIAILRHCIQAVAARVPNSFAQKAEMRLLIQALIIEFGLPAFWLTINPSDLRDILVLKLAGIPLPTEKFEKVKAKLRQKTANMNPAAVAVFFHKVCTAVLEGLINPKEDIGILGDVSNHFGVVESNGRGMLHLHGFVWLRGNIDFLHLRQKALNDPIFARQMVEYLESVISECINTSNEAEDRPDKAGECDKPDDSSSRPKPQDFDTEEDYIKALLSYGETVASMRQMHSKNHNSTCFKYCKKGTRECRFNFPRPIYKASHSDNLGVIHLRRNDQWVNPYNFCIAAAINSNHDLSFINTKAKSLALIYYMTNYSTKDEASTYQMVMAAATIRKALEQAQQATNPTDEESRALEKGISKFSLRLFNRMSLDREISGVQVASSLLQLPAYYTPRRDLYRVNLRYLRRRFLSIIRPSEDNEDGESTDTEEVAVGLTGKAPVTCFEDYRWRGPNLINLCLYEYLRLVRKCSVRNRISSDIDFAMDHPEYGEKTQIICDPSSIPRAIGLVGSLSQYQDIEDRIKGGHSKTLAIQNDIAVILLALFVPWEILPALFSDSMDICNDECQATCNKSEHTGLHLCAEIWARIEPSLPMHIRDFARNVELLRKSKEDGQVDITERRAVMAAATQDVQNLYGFDDEILEVGDMDMFENTDIETERVNDIITSTSIDDTSLFIACHLLRLRWCEQDAVATADIPSLYRSKIDIPGLSIDNFSPIVIDMASGIRQDISDDILKKWADLIKGTKASTTTGIGANINVDTDINESDVDLENEFGLLEPTLSFTDSNLSMGLNMEDLAAEIGPYCSTSHITDVITKAIPLNAKQKRTVSMIFYHVLRLQDKTSITLQDQFLLCVTGEGGTGKSRVINAVRLGMALLHREQEVLVLAPTGNAASNIGGSTIHTGLNVNIGNRRRRGPSSRVRALWSNKTMLIIDEISMVSSKLMDSIDNQCKILKNLDSNSTAVFGGLHIVIVLGDFHQFPPVQAKALWQKQESQTEKRGQYLWHLFKEVVILTEQMRQQHDTEYHDLLTRARNATLTEADVHMLNTRVVPRFESRPDHPNTCIVRLNKLRFVINRQQYEPLARYQKQQIFFFPARHSRYKMANGRNIDIDKLLELQDSSTVKSPGLFTYVKTMPAAILSNISTPLGIVNGAQGKIIGVIPDPDAKFYRMDSLHVLCTLPPKCVLFEPLSSKNAVFPGIGSTAVPVFCSSTSVKIENISVVRHQVPVTPAWAITDYKVQGATYDNITIDLHRPENNNNKETAHKRYCSNYVQLTRTKSLQGLNLLQPVTLSDLSVKPDKLLVKEDERLATLAISTEITWRAIETSDEFKLKQKIRLDRNL